MTNENDKIASVFKGLILKEEDIIHKNCMLFAAEIFRLGEASIHKLCNIVPNLEVLHALINEFKLELDKNKNVELSNQNLNKLRYIKGTWIKCIKIFSSRDKDKTICPDKEDESKSKSDKEYHKLCADNFANFIEHNAPFFENEKSYLSGLNILCEIFTTVEISQINEEYEKKNKMLDKLVLAINDISNNEKVVESRLRTIFKKYLDESSQVIEEMVEQYRNNEHPSFENCLISTCKNFPFNKDSLPSIWRTRQVEI